MRIIKKQQSIQHSGEGFTLVETLVAISILLIVIIGPMSIAARGLQSSFFANDQITAVFLAQEAMEAVIQLRDDQALAALDGTETDTWDWMDPIPSQCLNGPQMCDYNVGASNPADMFHACNGAGDPCLLQINLNAEADGYVYGYPSGPVVWENSQYTREIGINEPSAGVVSITVTVSWRANLFSDVREVVLQTWLYDHYSRHEP